MAIPRIVLFFAFRPIPDPDALRPWQRDLCEGLRDHPLWRGLSHSA